MAENAGHLPERIRKALDETRDQLLALHKALLDHERGRYEKAHGPVDSTMTLLQLVIEDPWFQWLKPLSALITQVDELSATKTPPKIEEAQALLTEAQRMVSPNEAGSAFQQGYQRVIQESPDVAYLHGKWKKRARSISEPFPPQRG
jgi:hypothetical protein